MERYFGLDIGSYYIKGVELSPTKAGTYDLVSFGVLPSPVNLTVTNSSNDVKAVAKTVRELVSTYHLADQVVLTLPEGQLFSFVIDFPRMSEKELAKSLQWEAEQYIPMPLEEVNLAYQIIHTPGEEKEKTMEVAIVAAPKELVKTYLAVVEAAGLRILAIENQTSAVVRSLATGGEKMPTTLYISLGASSTDFSIVRTGAVRFTRSIPTGGSVMSRSVAEHLGFEINQAEEYKKAHGLMEGVLEDKVKAALEPVITIILTEIRRAITFYTSRFYPDSIKRVVLFGGSCQLPGLLTHLATHLDLEFEIANSARLVTYPERVRHLRDQFLSLSPITTVATGLAMKPFDT